MYTLVILQHFLAPLLGHIHHRRLDTLLEAVASCVSGPALSLTDIGRRFAGPARLRHKIKRRDSPARQPPPARRGRSIYAALCRVTLARIQEPLILSSGRTLRPINRCTCCAYRCPLGDAASPSTRRSTPSCGSTTARSRNGFSIASPCCCRACGAGDRPRRRFQGALLRRSRAPGLALGRTVRGRDDVRLTTRWVNCRPCSSVPRPPDDAGGGRLGAQQPPAGAVRVGARGAPRGGAPRRRPGDGRARREVNERKKLTAESPAPSETLNRPP